MFKQEITIQSRNDFTSRYINRFVYAISNLLSIATILSAKTDRQANAKSILGLLSMDIKKGDTLKIVVYNNISQKQADDDIETIRKIFTTQSDVFK